MKYALLVISALLLVACGGSSSSGGSGSTAGSPTGSSSGSTPAPAATASTDAIKVSLVDFKINPATLSAKAGEVSFAVSNDGKAPHNFRLLDTAGKVVAKTADLSPGRSAVLKATLSAGTYSFDCSLPGHASLGMTGMLTVA